jgi:hypothetical protein
MTNEIALKTIILKFLAAELDNLIYGAIGVLITCFLTLVPDIPKSVETLLIGAVGVCIAKFKADK